MEVGGDVAEVVPCSPDVELTMRGDHAFVTLVRPERLNAIRSETLDGLEVALDLIENHASPVVVLSGAGRAFCAGADINVLDGATDAVCDAFMHRGQKIFSRLAELRAVTIAVVQGYALGGGFELALTADFIVATSSAKFGSPESALGHLPSWGGTYSIPSRTTRSIALDLMLSGRHIDAREGQQLGLVHTVCEPENTEQAVRALIDSWTDRGDVLRLIKEAVLAGERGGPTAAMQSERLGMALTRSHSGSKGARARFAEGSQSAGSSRAEVVQA